MRIITKNEVETKTKPREGYSYIYMVLLFTPLFICLGCSSSLLCLLLDEFDIAADSALITIPGEGHGLKLRVHLGGVNYIDSGIDVVLRTRG